MSQHSLVCTASGLKMTVDRMEEEEMVERRLEEVQGEKENMIGRNIITVHHGGADP